MHVHSINMTVCFACLVGSLPQQVTLDVVSAEPVAKGDEKTPQYKPAVVGSGRKIMVPPFIVTGTTLPDSDNPAVSSLLQMRGLYI